MSTPVITIFVRHAAGCKYAGDEFSKRCQCRKHFRWTQNGKQHRRRADARSWAEAEDNKRKLEDQLAGRVTVEVQEGRTISEAVGIFLQDKRNQGVTAGVAGKYARELARLQYYAEQHRVYTVQGITRELLTGFVGSWNDAYPSSYTRAKVRERVKSFLRYCYEAQWISRIPALTKIKVEEPPTLPLSDEEYARLLEAIPSTFPDANNQARVRALVQLMRWSGLAIRDALALRKADLQYDKPGGFYRVVTARQKTGTHISVPLPPAVAEELRTLTNTHPTYFFLTGKGTAESAAKNWARLYVGPAFRTAKIEKQGHMMSHRLRDTFAVDMLQKGVPLEEVSKLLGHESIRTTELHYSRWVKGRQDRLDHLVTGTWKK